MIRAGAALDVQNSDDETALQIAQSRGHAEIATLLEKAGASVG